MKWFGFMTVVAGALLLSVGTAAAVFQLTPEADTYVQNGAPDANYGGDDHMIAWDYNPTADLLYKIYMRFDLSSVTLPLDNAKLILTTIDGQFPAGTSLWGLNDGDAGELWDEMTMSWNDAPANDTSNNSLLSNATYLGDFNTPELQYPDPGAIGGTGDFFGATLKDFVNADTDGVATFMVISPGETPEPYNNGFVYIATKEHAELDAAILTDVAGLLGDRDGDGFVGQADLDIVLGGWGQTVPPADPRADPDGDVFVGQADLDTVLGDWGKGTPPAAVPDPATVTLLGLGALAVVRRKRR